MTHAGNFGQLSLVKDAVGQNRRNGCIGIGWLGCHLVKCFFAGWLHGSRLIPQAGKFPAGIGIIDIAKGINHGNRPYEQQSQTRESQTRKRNADGKIFSKDEGEYVDFEEV